ncbi:fumarylacetoacetate hydrolase family protein [Alteromonas sp. CYL-A6]|uniref:fumarylacetoacetate hydrolase family protein n=1 Tax=Alteromonas nitratireducens TaxID=3390813 RepID=UPI0034ACDD5B
MYQHLDNLGQPVDLPVGKVVCVGRNYLDHIEEMASTVPAAPLLFMKPAAALCALNEPLVIPHGRGECHNELEVAVLLSSPLSHASEDEVRAAVWGIGLGLDLTLRDVQKALKADGQPWERAKAFDRSCPVSGFVPVSLFGDWQDLHFTLSINDEIRQRGHTALMLHAIVPLIQEMSTVFSLAPGDVIMTGTPKGVGPLHAGDRITASLTGQFDVQTTVVQ